MSDFPFISVQFVCILGCLSADLCCWAPLLSETCFFRLPKGCINQFGRVTRWPVSQGGYRDRNPRWPPVLVVAQLTFFLLHLESKFWCLFYVFSAREIVWDNFQVPPTTNYPIINVITLIKTSLKVIFPYIGK